MTCCYGLVTGDIGFDDREILRDATSFEESLYKQPDHEPLVEEKTLNENANEKPMDVDNDIHAPMDDDLSPVDGGFMGKSMSLWFSKISIAQ